MGVPQLACECYTCKSDNVRNNRTRPSIVIRSDTTTILIDSSPDFRQQALRDGIKKLDAVIYTHAHADHIDGIDDLKPLMKSVDQPIPIYLNQQTYESINKSFGYLFTGDGLIYKPVLQANLIDDYSEVTIGDIKVQTFVQDHGSIKSLGIRVGELCYSTDFNSFPEKSMQIIAGSKYWILDCLRYHWAPTHSCYEQTLDYVDKIKPELAILTHMAHEMEYEELSRILPKHVVAGYDGMKIEFAISSL